MRMKVLIEADDVIMKMKSEAKVEVAKISGGGSYKQLVESLIVEALIRLNETSCSLVCRQQDVAVVKSVVNSARDKFVASARASGLAHMQEVGTKGCTVTVNEQTFLPPSPDQVASPDLPSCCGGIVALNGNGTISCANTLDARLDIAFEEQLPVIRDKIFGDMVLGQL